MTDSIELTVNGQTQTVTPGQTLGSLLDELAVNRKLVAVEVNAELVPREVHEAHALAAGDRVEIVTLVGGG